MTCESFRDLFELFRDGALTDAGAAEVREHLASCASCREFEADADAALSPLRGFPPGPYMPPAPPSFRLPPWGTGSLGALGLLAAFLAAGGGAWLILGGSTSPAGRETASAPPSGGPASPAAAERPVPAEVPGVLEPSPASAPSRLVGRLVLPDGSGLPGARVTIGSCAAETDAGGLFRFESLPPSLSRPALVEPPGLPSFRILLPPLPSGATIVLAPLESGPASTARIRVVGLDAHPVPGATVEAYRVPGVVLPAGVPAFPADRGFEGIPAVAATTGPDGIAVFEDLPRGAWHLRATGGGRAPSGILEVRVGPGGSLPRTILLEPARALEVTVVDSGTREPVPGAEVAWVRREGPRILGDVRGTRHATADERGKVLLRDLPSEPVLLAARRPGTAAFGGPTFVDAGRIPRAVLALEQEGDLEGVVLARGSGEPLAGAALDIHVTTRGARGALAATEHFLTAGPDGGFRIPRGRPEGCTVSVRVLASALGPAAPVQVGNVSPVLPSPGSGPLRVEVDPRGPGAADPAKSLLEAVPAPAPEVAIVRGVVAGPDGRVPEGVRLSWSVASGRLSMDQDGLPHRALEGFAVPVAADGSFEAEVRMRPAIPGGPNPSILFGASAPGFSIACIVEPKGPDRPTEGLRLELKAGKTLRGRVVDEHGAPVADFPVEAALAGETPGLPYTLTGPDGSFAIEGLLAGLPVHLLCGWWHDFRGARGPFVPGGEDVVLRLPATKDLEVRLRGPDGAPAPGVVVSWISEDGSRISGIGRSGEHGVARFPRVPRVPLRIRTGMVNARAGDPGDFLQAGTGAAQHDGTPVDVALVAGLAVAGTVEGPGGVPLAEASVEAEFPGAERRLRRQVLTAEDGTFDLRGLPAGTHRVRATWRGLRGEVEGEAGTRGHRIHVEGATDAPATVEGRVLTPEGAPVSGAVVSLHSGREGVPPQQYTTGPDGRYSLRAARGANCTLVARDPKGLAAYAEGAEGGVREVVLRPGSRGSGIGGTVARPDGSAAGGVPVVALRLDAPGGPEAGLDLSSGLLTRIDHIPPGPAYVRATVTDPTGSFDLGSPPGRWVVFAGIPGTGAAPGPAAVLEEADRSPLDLVTGEGWTLRARIVDDEAAGGGACRVEVRLGGLLPSAAPAPFVKTPLPASGALEVPGLPPGPAAVVLLDAEGRERARWRVEGPAPGDEPVELRTK